MATRTRQRGRGRSASQKPDKYRFAQNVDGEATIAEHEYRSYAEAERDDAGDTPDVLLDVPVVKVDSIHLEVEDLAAQVSLQAKVLDLLDLDVGVEVYLDRLKLDIKGVEAQALLKVRLDHVAAIVDRLMTTLDRNPDLIESIGKAVEDVGAGGEHTLGKVGDAEKQLGSGAADAVEDVGEGAGDAVGEIGKGAGEGVGELGQGAGEAVGDVGEGAGGAVGQLGEAAGGVVGGLGDAAGQTAGAVGDVAGQVGSGQGDGESGGLDLDQLTDAAGAPTGPKLAKAAAKTVATEIGSAASDEAKDLGMAAMRKVKELGARRRRKRAERHHATGAAIRLASELGVDLEEIEGSGADGRIVVGDVRDAAEE